MSKIASEHREAAVAAAASACKSELSNKLSNFYDSNDNSITSDYNYSNSQSFHSEFNDIDNVYIDRSSYKLRINNKDKGKNGYSSVISENFPDKPKYAFSKSYKKRIQEPQEQINCLETTQTLTPTLDRKLKSNEYFKKIFKVQEEIALSKTCVKKEQELSQAPSSLLSSSCRLRTYSSFSDLSSSRSAESLRNNQKSMSDTLNASYSSCGCATSCSCRSSSHKESSVLSSSIGKGTCLNVSTRTSCKESDSNCEMHSQCTSINENYQTFADNTAYTKLAQELGLPPLIHLRQRRQQLQQEQQERENNTISTHCGYADNLDSQSKNVQESQERHVADTADDLIAMTATITPVANTEKNKTVHNNNMIENKYCAGQQLQKKNENNKLVDKNVNNDNEIHMESKCNTVTVKESSVQTECESTAETNDTKAAITATITTITIPPMTSTIMIAEEMLITKKEMADLLLELFMQFSEYKLKEMELEIQKKTIECSSQTEKQCKARCISRAVSPIRPAPIKIYHCAVQTMSDNNREAKINNFSTLENNISNEEFNERYNVITQMEDEARKNLELLIQESLNFIQSAEMEYRRIRYEYQARNTLSNTMQMMLFNVISEEFNNRKQLELEECNNFTKNIERVERNAAHELNLLQTRQNFRDEMHAKEQELQNAEIKLSQMEEELTKAAKREQELTQKYITALKLPTVNINNVTGQVTKRVNRRDDSNDNNCSASWPDDLPIHRRFARAHQEAIKVVTAQRQTCLS